MQSPRSDREQRVVSVLGAMGNDQGTGSRKREEGAGRRKARKEKIGGKEKRVGKEKEGGFGNLEMKH